MIPEILAPAGSRETLEAAVRCGADAVYFGGKAFNARRNASNFDDEEISEAIDYCHRRNVKVYITLNTLVSDGEMKEACREIEKYCLAGTDAFIIQDIGLASVVRQVCSSVALHASTQMSVQSIHGLEMLEELGFCRAVLPRELSEKEIRAISSGTSMELEAFVHGALCMCLSGQCLMSSMLGGRSGNRGLCAQPCRLPFGVNGPGGNNLSLKDLSLIDRIPALADAGVSSLKIEGRMKRPEYVAAAVTACRNAIDGKEDKKITDALGAVFSRSGFTSGYFDAKPGREMFGIRTKDDVESTSPVLSSLHHLYDNENPLLPVEMSFEMKADSPAKLTACYNGITSGCTSDSIPSPAINKPVTAEDAAGRLSKCGGTQFYIDNISCNIEPGLNMPVSAMNALRRQVLSDLENKIASKPEPVINPCSIETDLHKVNGRSLHIRLPDASLFTESIRADRIIIPLNSKADDIKKLLETGIEIAAEVPVNIFGNGQKYLDNLERLRSLGVERAWVCNADGLVIARKAGMKISSGFGMNVYNSQTINELQKAGVDDCLLSCECSAAESSHMGGSMPRGIVAYGRIPLMVTRNCPIRNKLTCSECGGRSELCDRKNIRFPVRCSDGCSFILNSVPICVYDKQKDFNVDYDLLYFTTESADECSKILSDYTAAHSPDYEYTRGLYYRKVL